MSHADRREAVSRRLAVTSEVLTRLDLVLAGTQDRQPLDPDGTLRAALHALVTDAYRQPGFDVKVSSGPSHEWAIRLRNAEGRVNISLVRAGRPDAVAVPGTEVVTELASLLWDRELGGRR